MAETLSTTSLRAIFKFPFQSPDWSSRFIIGAALLFAGMVIPIVPVIFVYGYIVQVMRQAIKGEPPVLPEWKDWGQLGRDGLRSMAVGLAYLLPGAAILIGGWVLYMVTWIGGMTMISAAPREAPPPIFFVLLFGSIAILFISMFVGSLAYLLGILPLPAALAHFVAQDKLGAAFRVKEWWAILRADKWGYFISWVVTMGLVSVMYFAIMLVYFTGILCFLIYFIGMPLGFYLLLVAAVLFGQFYREGVERLNARSAETAQEQVQLDIITQSSG